MIDPQTINPLVLPSVPLEERSQLPKKSTANYSGSEKVAG